MTPAFQIFLTEYHRTGSEKADGYSNGAFAGLSAMEKQAVFKMLETELPCSAQWLFVVDIEKAIGVAKAEEERLRGDSFAHVFLLQEYLVRHSRDLLYQEHMIEDFPHYIDRLKPLVVDSLARTPANATTLSFFRQVILEEPNASAVARASRHFLDAMKLPRFSEQDDEERRRLLRELTSGDRQVRAGAIARIDAGAQEATRAMGYMVRSGFS
jgi:hypothetical protein